MIDFVRFDKNKLATVLGPTCRSTPSSGPEFLTFGMSFEYFIAISSILIYILFTYIYIILNTDTLCLLRFIINIIDIVIELDIPFN